ncbi:MAG: adenylyltransferase/cytidyltransferase family protein, partial [Gemmatimonadaceae bacterium]
MTVVTFGTYDLFHVGHLNILQRAKELGDRLVVGVSSDELNFRKKQIRPTYPLDHRMADPLQLLNTLPDLFQIDFSAATVVTLALSPEINARLESKLRKLRPGTRIVSRQSPIG